MLGITLRDQDSNEWIKEADDIIGTIALVMELGTMDGWKMV